MISTVHATQQSQLAGKTKLTAVTIGHGSHKVQFFAMLHHDSKGAAILPQAVLNKQLDKLWLHRGDAYSVGC